ncbi:MAG: ribosome recycling factor [Candidatus Staskawiczbacteria bacterium RIFCSPHIGHO2_02_FULL_43_16]|uniref:Ribosome recycling factor n=1 Tax=Candidatus Staskawiczbacteria bacterium RIFCSPHIGHO2_01_FULL_41_41 TaxID=1802203 RepID=A0A1G2HTN6_9BACT|nr:MAG: ribosome recycling factor [Candidatus Staskawiczbacteria bacterium RIFCSPHIGHO2_01_FULL_41_41]OGZ68291.1 MAG: ribosome recycling factor [Candidatus Staskawiczbacteria bacterium RIFCSPHIGHO2_02_FULL_43_16]OGZ74680.1 MAG: ribosome recycling factor [Candidatus Staskawiczbacteria bacterium RIFCSPLOWO2_01_FULL_43_17b]
MLYKEFIEKVKPEFEKALAFLSGELAKIRTSHASPALVEDVQVDYLGQKYALKQLAAISTPQTNQIVIQPWDGSYIQSIEQAVLKSGLGMSAAVDGSLIRLNLPTLTQEYRDTLIKLLNEKAEQARQTLRHWREDAWNKIQAAQKAKALTEDDKFKAKEDLQKMIDEYSKKIKELIERKEKEVA